MDNLRRLKTTKKFKSGIKAFWKFKVKWKIYFLKIYRENAVGPGHTMSKVFPVRPLLKNNKFQRGLALDGQLKHEDTNLASSTL